MVGRAALLRRFPKSGMRVQIPCLPLVKGRPDRLDGEMDDHTLLLTRHSGFESWSGQFAKGDLYGVRSVAVSARLAVNQKVAVQLRSDTLT